MSYDRPRAIRENAPVLLGLAGTSGSGKTYTAMELATGLAGGRRFCVIDTENGRARHYADDFDFAAVDLYAPFRPARYAEAIAREDAAGAPVIVVDSASHEHAGEGGLLDWHDDELERVTRGDQSKRDAFNRLAWIAPKSEHKRVFVPQLLKTRAHVILCFRAEQKTDQVKDPKTGKTKFVAKEFPGAPPEFADGVRGWGPIAEKSLIFEMTASFLFLADNPGVPIPIKCPERLRPMFPDDKQIGRTAGEALARWAAGSSAAPATQESAPTGATLADVLAGIDAAQTEGELKAIAKYALALGDSDKPKAREAYEAKRVKLRG